MLLQIMAVLITLVSSIGIYNFFTADRLHISISKSTPFVSILIPARNEEKNIASCLDSVLKQNYPAYEVIVCDDQSKDTTSEQVKSFQSYHQNLHLIPGQALPEGWTGKNWACWQLAQKAQGQWYLFLDADVTLEPEGLASAVALAERKKVVMLSCFPQQIMKSFSEWMLVPLVDWLSLSFIFLDLVYCTKNPRFSVAIGQFILIHKEAYEAIGGHASIRTAVIEDMEMARRLKFQKQKILAARSAGLVCCRMYYNFQDAKKGLTRFIFLGSKLKPYVFAFSLAGMMALFVTPFILFFFNTFYLLLFIPPILQRILTSLLARQNIFINLILLPVHYLFFFYLSMISLSVALGNTME